MRQAARHGLQYRLTPAGRRRVSSPLPAQHESFNEKWGTLCERLKIIPAGVRAIGPSVLDVHGQAQAIAGDVRLHPSLVRRFGQRVTTILDERKGARREGEYLPVNVRAGTLPTY